MSTTLHDDAPSTRRVSTPTGDEARYVVKITYREPGYAERSGTRKSYTGSFVVHAVSERDAVAQAKIEFESIAALSGVSWVRLVDRIECRRVRDGERDPQ
jgi:hypothetical protein